MPAARVASARVGLLLVTVACARVDVASAQTAVQLFDAGNTQFDAKRYAEARAPYLRAATEFKHAGAQYMVGQFYFYGRGVTASKTEGVRWWKMASAQGYDLAHTMLGRAFQRGEGVPAADAGEAVRLYTLGAAQGEVHGLLNLGDAYADGLGPLAASEPAALELVERAARQGDGGAQMILVLRLTVRRLRIYISMGGVVRNDTMSLELFWCQLAADGGQADAKQSLPDYRAQCTGDCRTEAEALIAAFRVEDVCKASRYTRENHCSGRGTPTPE